MLSLIKTCQGFKPVIVYLSLICAVSVFFAAQSYAAEAVGKFTHVEGKVDILRQGNLPAIPAHVDDALFQKDIVRTKSSARAEIRFRDNTVLRIAQRSRIDISEYFTGDSNKGIIKLSRGQVQAVVDKNVTKRISLAPGANRFEIQTPNAVAGVRGTIFDVLYDRNITTVLLKDGDICVFNIKAEANVVCMPPGYIVTISGDRVPQPPRKATDTEIRIFEKEILPDRAETQGLENIISVPEGVPSSNRQPLRDDLASVFPIVLPITEFIPALEHPSPPTPEDTYHSNFGVDVWSNYPLASDGNFNGTLHGTTAWSTVFDRPVSALITGTYSAGSNLPHIWFENNIFSSNSENSNHTTSDGGAYRGFIGGRETGQVGDAKVTGLYIDPSGNTGILSGDFNGTIIGTNLSMTGALSPVQMGSDSISPVNFYDNIATDSFSVTGSGTFNSSGSGIAASGTYNSMNINGHTDWGISQMVLGGSYPAPSGDLWSLSFTGSSGAGHTFDADLAGTQWSSNRINASASGYWVDARTAAPSTGIYIGETIGTFNPADLTWQAITTGTWLETNRFLQMAADPAGRNKLQQLNIPAFEVGRTNLTGSLVAGSGESLDYMSVLMNNVAFFAPSNGQKPGIWATNAVSGQYDFSHGMITPGTVTNADNVIAISNGNGINADFQFTRWDTTNNTWSSSIQNGTGTLSGGSYNGPVNFRGGAAGTLTGAGSGSLSGTAAGIVK
jgi:FecR protein